MSGSQNLVDLMGRPPARAGRASHPQRPKAANPAGVTGFFISRGGIATFLVLRACGVAAIPPTGEAQGLARQVVERRGQRLEPAAETARIDRIVGRGRAACYGKRLGEAGK